jgi:sterol desaturase/sphingolipid hydroxylase (fatty acid hydroxylase superfamily)
MSVARVWATIFGWDFGRYVLAAGVAFLLVWVWGRERWRSRLIQGRYADPKDIRREMAYSLSTAFIFSLVGTSLWFGAKAGIFRMYARVGERGWLYFAFSIVALIVIQDTYFYWTHRALHSRWLFKHFHRAHHLSHNPSPWAAYAFAPGEALVQAAYVPLVALVMPVHTIALFLFLAFMISRNVFGHLGVEVLGASFVKSPWLRWSTTTTHHALHHRRSDVNYGLYFTFWDCLMRTTHPRYESTFEEIAARPWE